MAKRQHGKTLVHDGVLSKKSKIPNELELDVLVGLKTTTKKKNQKDKLERIVRE